MRIFNRTIGFFVCAFCVSTEFGNECSKKKQITKY